MDEVQIDAVDDRLELWHGVELFLLARQSYFVRQYSQSSRIHTTSGP